MYLFMNAVGTSESADSSCPAPAVVEELCMLIRAWFSSSSPGIESSSKFSTEVIGMGYWGTTT